VSWVKYLLGGCWCSGDCTGDYLSPHELITARETSAFRREWSREQPGSIESQHQTVSIKRMIVKYRKIHDPSQDLGGATPPARSAQHDPQSGGCHRFGRRPLGSRAHEAVDKMADVVAQARKRST